MNVLLQDAIFNLRTVVLLRRLKLGGYDLSSEIAEKLVQNHNDVDAYYHAIQYIKRQKSFWMRFKRNNAIFPLSEHYAERHADLCFILLGKHQLNINPIFWGVLAWRLTKGVVTADDFNQWVSLLLETAPRYVDPHSLLMLAEKSVSLDCTYPV